MTPDELKKLIEKNLAWWSDKDAVLTAVDECFKSPYSNNALLCGPKAEPLALLEQEMIRINDARLDEKDPLKRYNMVEQEDYIESVIEFIKGLQQKANGA